MLFNSLHYNFEWHDGKKLCFVNNSEKIWHQTFDNSNSSYCSDSQIYFIESISVTQLSLTIYETTRAKTNSSTSETQTIHRFSTKQPRFVWVLKTISRLVMIQLHSSSIRRICLGMNVSSRVICMNLIAVDHWMILSLDQMASTISISDQSLTSFGTGLKRESSCG